jgi:hypothetical protein
LGQQDEEIPEPEKPKMFEGVPFTKWQEVERFINQVNSTPIPAEMSISKKPTTLYEEWRALFDLIYRRREVSQRSFRGPVRQSEGDYLDDVVDAYIDTKAGETDPMGYKKEAEKKKEVLEVTEFEDDVVLDLTGSMKSSGAYLEQKKMVLANSANIMGLNRRLNLSYNKNSMKAPLSVKTHIASFKGSNTTQLHHTRDDQMNEKKLCELYDAFDDTETGMGNLHGALVQYRASITSKLSKKIKQGKLKKVLTIISDGEVNNQSGIVSLVSELRELGIIVQGIGFGDGSESIRVICHNPNDPQATATPDNIKGATIARHNLLVKHLKNI